MPVPVNPRLAKPHSCADQARRFAGDSEVAKVVAGVPLGGEKSEARMAFWTLGGNRSTSPSPGVQSTTSVMGPGQQRLANRSPMGPSLGT